MCVCVSHFRGVLKLEEDMETEMQLLFKVINHLVKKDQVCVRVCVGVRAASARNVYPMFLRAVVLVVKSFISICVCVCVCVRFAGARRGVPSRAEGW